MEIKGKRSHEVHERTRKGNIGTKISEKRSFIEVQKIQSLTNYILRVLRVLRGDDLLVICLG